MHQLECLDFDLRLTLLFSVQLRKNGKLSASVCVQVTERNGSDEINR